MARTESPAPPLAGPPPSRGRTRQRAIDELSAILPAIKRRVSEHPMADPPLSHVTPHQADALCMLSREGAMSMNDLARNLNVAMSTATALADRLLKQGQVERIADPTDRRVVRLALTGEAAATVKYHMQSKREAFLQVLDVLDDGELAELVALLRKVAGSPQNTTSATGRY